MGSAAPIFQVIGGIVGSVGALAEGSAQSASARYNAAVERGNARIARENSAIAGQSGEVQAFNVGLHARNQIGGIKANQGAGNIDVNSGSAADVRSSATELAELDAMTARSNATRTAYGYEQQARSFENKANLDIFEAKNDIQASQYKAATTLLSAGGQASESYQEWQNAGGSGMFA